ncbi:primosomal protein N' [Bacteriovorax stolpii]|uniref:Replication restart protein PriA n=1 Tax=Bacteriovorax stolpii TaxID=960 RepID=A0A2K9NX51_BACTC|nr:primosomal protein N' [Bacteriovorax stolpii]AUO00099.1 primosomal protein N' [Bacteriovorax stolpii]TDP54008.1 replication restart DNA helicase PriA [Bacteriovorax stolpii]
MEKTLFLVAVNTPFNGSMLTYSAGGELAQKITKGTLVKVPLGKGKRSVDGCVWQQVSEQNIDLEKIKDITEASDELTLSKEECDLFQWMASYYHYPLGQLIFDVLPPFLKRPRKLNYDQGKGEESPFVLSPDQQNVVAKIAEAGFDKFTKSLVHGVTGAGKTLIYLELIQKIIKEKKSVLFLLPEINLTPQFLKTFETYLNVPIYSYNSAISNSDKFGLWKLLQEDSSPKLILGVRSSVFLPIKNLGLIIVDEEHDQSFKQDDRCTYNARDIAIKRASLLKIPVILGSATPMVETYKAFVGTTHYFPLTKRAQEAKLPEVELVDMRGRARVEAEKMLWPYSSESVFKIRKALEKGEQVLVFINRLGYASYLQCNSCGHQFACPNCSTNLKYFKKRSELVCQTCEYKSPAPEMCPECMNIQLTPKGFGTEKAHDTLQELFPDRVVERFDRDEIKTFGKLEETLDLFHQKKIDILVGTQMLSKGHNFENVNLVIILGIDSQLNFPDFRSNERVYQTLTQVSGRAGRFGKKAEVLVHTLAPENKIFSYLKNHSFDDFYKDEIPLREMCSSPPVKKIILLYINGKHQAEVIKESSTQAERLSELAHTHFNKVDVLGPRPSMIEKKVNKFTWSLLLRSDDINQLHNLLNTFLKNYRPPHTISLKIDVDPYYFD